MRNPFYPARKRKKYYDFFALSIASALTIYFYFLSSYKNELPEFIEMKYYKTIDKIKSFYMYPFPFLTNDF
jgi:hypothetical protein